MPAQRCRAIFQMAFLRPVLALADTEIILRSGSTAELLAGLAALNLDIVLTNEPPPVDTPVRYLAHELDAQPVSLVGAPALLTGDQDIAMLLAAHPVILPASGSLRTSFDALASRLGVPLRVAAEVDDMAMMRLLVREATALAVVPPIVVADELASGTACRSRSAAGHQRDLLCRDDQAAVSKLNRPAAARRGALTARTTKVGRRRQQATRRVRYGPGRGCSGLKAGRSSGPGGKKTPATFAAGVFDDVVAGTRLGLHRRSISTAI